MQTVTTALKETVDIITATHQNNANRTSENVCVMNVEQRDEKTTNKNNMQPIVTSMNQQMHNKQTLAGYIRMRPQTNRNRRKVTRESDRVFSEIHEICTVFSCVSRDEMIKI